MFGSAKSGANQYATVGLETGVVAATPHKLIGMLFDGAMIAVQSAIPAMKAGDVPTKGNAISKAIMIIENGLRASLDKSVGGEIALNLDALYAYMSTRLMLANVKNQPAMLDEVYGLLKDLKGAWEGIGETATPAAAPTGQPANAPKASAYDALAPQTSRLIKA